MNTTGSFVLAALIIAAVDSQSCKQDSPKSVCSHPKPIVPDIEWFQSHQPADGWHMELSNAVVRLHLAELIQGKLLTYNDDFSNMCGRSRSDPGKETTVHGKMYGFNGRKVDYLCYPSKATDEPGATDCDFSSVSLSKYEDHSLNYLTHSDDKNVVVAILCFPNGESGWFSMSGTTSLTDEERKTVLDHVKSIGYDTSDVVSMYNETCTDNSVDASYFVRKIVRPEAPRRFRNRQRSRSNFRRHYEI